MSRNFIHLRRKFPNGLKMQLSNFGGMTICQEPQGNMTKVIGDRGGIKFLRFLVGIAVCSNKDRYVRKEGRKVSWSRLNETAEHHKAIDITAERNFEGTFTPSIIFQVRKTIQNRLQNEDYILTYREYGLYHNALRILREII